MRPNVRKHTFAHVRPAKIQISLRTSAVWSESSLGAFRIAKDAKFLHADTKDWSDCTNAQTGLSICCAARVRRYGFSRWVYRLDDLSLVILITDGVWRTESLGHTLVKGKRSLFVVCNHLQKQKWNLWLLCYWLPAWLWVFMDSYQRQRAPRHVQEWIRLWQQLHWHEAADWPEVVD